MPPTDRERIHTALRFYVDRVTWPLGDSERDRFMALRDEYAADDELRCVKCGDPIEEDNETATEDTPTCFPCQGAPEL